MGMYLYYVCIPLILTVLNMSLLVVYLCMDSSLDRRFGALIS